MSNAYTTFRANLQATLSAALTGYTWVAGPPPNGKVPDQEALGFVWVERQAMDTSNKLLEAITCGVRMYVLWDQQIDPQTPDDPTALEQAASDLQTTLKPDGTPGDPWYFDVETIDFDHGNGYIEAAVTGHRWNDAAVS